MVLNAARKTTNESVRVKTQKIKAFCEAAQRRLVKKGSRVFMRAIRSSALWGSMRVSTQAGGLSLSTHCMSSGLALIEENRNASDQEWRERDLHSYIGGTQGLGSLFSSCRPKVALEQT